jgi:hypothetical protein
VGFSVEQIQNPQPEQAAEKVVYFCHSERSEESLLGLNEGNERFLGAQRASE